MRAGTLIVAFFCLTLNACALGPDYTRPELPVPERWSSTATAAQIDTLVQPRWWTAFGDPELDALLQAAVAQNLDLKIAAANLEQSRAAARVATAPLWGMAALQPRYAKTKQSGRIVEEPSATLREQGVIASPNPSKQYSLPLEASYEFDLWGRLRRGREAARAEFHAQDSGDELLIEVGNTFVLDKVSLAVRAVEHAPLFRGQLQSMSEGLEHEITAV